MRAKVLVMTMATTLLCGLATDAGAMPARVEGQDPWRRAAPNTLYTVWVDHRSRATGDLAADYPLDEGALERGVAPAFATDAPVYDGMLPDLNALITDADGHARLDVELDYNLLEAGSSPVVGGELATQGANVVGGYWLRQYETDPGAAASAQVIDPKSVAAAIAAEHSAEHHDCLAPGPSNPWPQPRSRWYRSRLGLQG